MDFHNVGQWSALLTVIVGVLAYTIKVTLAYGKLDRRQAVTEEKVQSLENEAQVSKDVADKTLEVALETNTEVKVTRAKIDEIEKRLDRDHDRRVGAKC